MSENDCPDCICMKCLRVDQDKCDPCVECCYEVKHCENFVPEKESEAKQ